MIKRRRGITLSLTPDTPSKNPCTKLGEELEELARTPSKQICTPPPSPIHPPLAHGKFGTISAIKEDPTKLLKQSRTSLFVQKEKCDNWNVEKLKSLLQEYKREKEQLETYQNLKDMFPLYLPLMGEIEEGGGGGIFWNGLLYRV